MSECTCNHCGWVHFALKRAVAQAEVDSFNKYFDRLPESQREHYGGEPSKIENYERCFNCGQADGDFRPAADGDCPRGCTIQPVIWEPEATEE